MVRNQTITAVPRGRSAAAVVAVAAALALLMSFVAPVPTAKAFTDESARGIDVSRWQHPEPESIDWERVAGNGESFAIIKATDPVDGPNPNFENDSAEAHEHGLIIGAYHKAHPDLDATEQADDFVKALELQPDGATTLPPVLDLELANGQSPEEINEWAHEFMERVEEKAGRQPMMYTYRSFWRVEMGDTTDFSEYPLWLAAYQDEPPTDDIPGGWDQMTIWQRSETGKVDGLITPVDLDVFNGTEADLKAFADEEKSADELTDTFADLMAAGSTSDKAYNEPISADTISKLIDMLDTMARDGVDPDQASSIFEVLFSLVNSASEGAGSSGGTVDIPETSTETKPAETETAESEMATESETSTSTDEPSATVLPAEPTETATTEPTESEATEPTENTEATESTEEDGTEDQATEINVDDLTDEEIGEIAEATDLTEEQVIEYLSELRFDNLLSMLRGMLDITESGDFEFTISDLIDVLNSSLR